MYNTDKIKELYSFQGKFFLLLTNKDNPYLELDENSNESVLKLFINENDIVEYSNRINTLGHKFKYQKARSTLDHLWQHIKYINLNTVALSGCPLRINVCCFNKNNLMTIDSIFSSIDSIH